MPDSRRRPSRPAPPRGLTARAFAKINLSLQVLGRRADGYHELRTIFQSIALHDTVVVQAGGGELRLDCDDPRCPADRTNLVWRAAASVWKAAGRRGAPRGVSIALRKRIPVQAGLGGGSSDAAAALRLFGCLWAVGERRLRDIARSLGADVLYFFDGGTSLGLDRGDLLFPLVDAPPRFVTLVIPDFRVSTAEAYGWWDVRAGRFRRGAPGASRGLRVADCGLKIGIPGLQPSTLVNDLERPVTARHPEIGRIVEALIRAGAVHAAMTGSGSGVFGLFDDRADAGRAAAAIGRAPRRAIVTRSVNRRACERLAAVRPIV